MLSLGSGDPARAICSTLIALAFQSVRYPILPGPTLACGFDPHVLRWQDRAGQPVAARSSEAEVLP